MPVPALRGFVRACARLLVVGSICALSACGGGGDAAPAGSPPAQQPGGPQQPQQPQVPQEPFGTAVALKFSTDLAQRQGRSTTTTVRVLAVNASGATLDVTDQSEISVDAPERLSASRRPGGELELSFSEASGPVNLHVQALGLSIDKAMWVTRLNYSTIESIRLGVGEGFSSMIKGADGSYSMLPARDLVVTVLVSVTGFGEIDMSDEAQVTSSNEAVVMGAPWRGSGPSVLWWRGQTLQPGTAAIKGSWAGLEASQPIKVSPGLIVRASDAKQGGLTESASGRVTAYAHLTGSASDTNSYYIESAANNQWGDLVMLPTPPSVLGQFERPLAAESQTGYRALLTSTVLKDVWVHLIGPGGEVKGPVMVSEGGPGNTYPLQIAVGPDGSAHVWAIDMAAGQLKRKVVRFADTSVALVSTLARTPDGYLPGRVSISAGATVALTGVDTACGLHYAFDDLLSPSPSGPTHQGVVNVSECKPDSFAAGIKNYDRRRPRVSWLSSSAIRISTSARSNC
jgi:hypothetical protein